MESRDPQQASVVRFSTPTVLNHLELKFDDGQSLFFNGCLLASYSDVFLEKLMEVREDWTQLEQLPMGEEKFEDFVTLLSCLDLKKQRQIDDSNVEILANFAVDYKIDVLKERVVDYVKLSWKDQKEKFISALLIGIQLDSTVLIDVFTPLAAGLPLNQLIAEREVIPPGIFKEILDLQAVDDANVDLLVSLAEELDLNSLAQKIRNFVVDWWSTRSDKFIGAVKIGINLKQKSLAQFFLPRAATLPFSIPAGVLNGSLGPAALGTWKVVPDATIGRT